MLFYNTANGAEFRDRTPEQVVATLAGRDVYLGSVSTLYRILRKRGALRHRHESKKPAATTSRQHIEVTGPNQVWSWDITWLRNAVHGLVSYITAKIHEHGTFKDHTLYEVLDYLDVIESFEYPGKAATIGEITKKQKALSSSLEIEVPA